MHCYPFSCIYLINTHVVTWIYNIRIIKKIKICVSLTQLGFSNRIKDCFFLDISFHFVLRFHCTLFDGMLFVLICFSVSFRCFYGNKEFCLTLIKRYMCFTLKIKLILIFFNCLLSNEIICVLN